MRFPDEPAGFAVALMMAVLAGCAGTPPAHRVYAPGMAAAPDLNATSDYPKTIGAPYRIGSTLYTPSDTMNYDAVGYAMVGTQGGSRIYIAHHTLPVPSYVEVTSLISGRTILARIDARGPMNSHDIVEVSPGAAEQLGISQATPVRVRRVNPPESERALLRSGGVAPARMPTPKTLLSVLMHRLDAQGSVVLNPSSSLTSTRQWVPGTAKEPAPMAPTKILTHDFVKHRIDKAKHTPTIAEDKAANEHPSPHALTRQSVPAKAETTKTGKPLTGKGVSLDARYIQIGAFAVKANAEALSRKVDGVSAAKLSSLGRLWVVRTGPYRTQADAEAALAKLKTAGYSVARIQRAD